MIRRLWYKIWGQEKEKPKIDSLNITIENNHLKLKGGLPINPKFAELGDYFEIIMENRGNFDRFQWDEYMVRFNEFIGAAESHGYWVSSGEREGRTDAPFAVIFRRGAALKSKNNLVEGGKKILEKLQ